MTIAWPSTLSTKRLAVAGYNEDVLVDPSVRTTNDSGPPKARSRFTFVPKKIDGSIDTLTTTEVDYLLAFFETTCANGSLPFTWIHPRRETAVTFMWLKYPVITPANGSPIIFSASMSLLQIA